MALLDNSYGDPAEIAKLVPRWATSGGVFDATTSPLLATVESWCDQISGLLNTVLAAHGFQIPVTDSDVKLMLDMFVNEEAAAMADGVHGSGRFGPTALNKSGMTRYHILKADASAFIEEHAVGMERLGATRDQSVLSSLGYRQFDESGDEVHPFFQREAFGESYRNYDT